ncbi:hypothetical protein [Mycobacterium sp. E3247]|uniref:hypothetical protein n=1 Tax=Mycobacterium sp. E3247 TaxID=1856864 RepID=UPI0008001DE4|nr:hypothetical protein [Mycobacterium sp. E3247]OBH19801.1 hypothetical protein A9X04_07490 [Mycobacterium sp. E3247]
MDVVLGVAVTGPVARLALVGPGAQGADVIDQSVVNLEDNPVGKLTETVVGTNRLLADENHRLVGTRVCWSDDPRAGQLRQALQDSGVSNVAVLSESQAVAALMRAAGRPGAVLVMDDATATLSVPGSADDQNSPPTVLAREPLAGGDVTATFNTMMAQLSARPDAPGEVYLVGASPELAQVADQLRDASSTMRVQVADEPAFAVARGAAMAAAAGADATAMAPAVGLTGDETAMAPGLTGDETAMAPGLTGDETAMAPGLTGDETTVVPPPAEEEPQLAYSMADDAEPFAGDEYGPEFDDYDHVDQTEAIPSRLSRRSLVVGNAVIAFAVVGFASLAAAIAIAVRPTASQQPVVGHQNAAPGKFMPLLPTQQQAPVPPPPVDQPNAGFQGGTLPAPTAVPQQVAPPAGGGAPAAPAAPVEPGAPGGVPNPNPVVPVPVPVIVPFPGWQPGYPQPPYNPPSTTTITPPTTSYEPPTTSISPPTTSISPPTTSISPPTTSISPPTTSYSPPTTSYSPPTTSYSPPTTSYSPPPTSHEQPPTTYSPPPHTQETAPPTHSQETLVPQQPRSHRGF